MYIMWFIWLLGIGLLTKTILAKNKATTLIAYSKLKAGKVTIAAINNKAYNNDAIYNNSDDWP
jgi:hypothetical protein